MINFSWSLLQEHLRAPANDVDLTSHQQSLLPPDSTPSSFAVGVNYLACTLGSTYKAGQITMFYRRTLSMMLAKKRSRMTLKKNLWLNSYRWLLCQPFWLSISCFNTYAQGTLIRNSKKFWNVTTGETAWFESASSEARTSLPPISVLPELRNGDIFLHKITLAAENSPTTYQLWLRVNDSWSPIKPGYNLTDVNGRDRTLVMTSDNEPSWVLRGTARKNYNPKKKSRTPE